MERYWVWEYDLKASNPQLPDVMYTEKICEVVLHADAQQRITDLEQEVKALHDTVADKVKACTEMAGKLVACETALDAEHARALRVVNKVIKEFEALEIDCDVEYALTVACSILAALQRGRT